MYQRRLHPEDEYANYTGGRSRSSRNGEDDTQHSSGSHAGSHSSSRQVSGGSIVDDRGAPRYRSSTATSLSEDAHAHAHAANATYRMPDLRLGSRAAGGGTTAGAAGPRSSSSSSVHLGSLLFEQPDANAGSGPASAYGDGPGPRSTSPTPSSLSLLSSSNSVTGSYRTHDYLGDPTSTVLSPAASIHSFHQSSASSTGNAVGSRAHKVALPLNQHGVRTRVNILPPARIVSGGTGSVNAGGGQPGSSVSTKGRPGSSSSAHLLGRALLSHGDSNRTSIDSTNSWHGRDQEGGPRRVSNLGVLNATGRSTGHPVYHMLSATRRIASEGQPTGPMTSQSQPSSGVAAVDYAFPARSAGAQMYNHDSYASSSTRLTAGDTPDMQHNGAYSLSQSSTASSNGPHTPNRDASTSSVSVYQTPASSKPSPHPEQHRQNGAVPAGGGQSKPYPPTVQRALLPGGYDFSPVSSQTHDGSAYESSSYRPSANGGTPTPFSYARDRSASVPRTVSSLGDSGRSSSEDFHRQFAPSLANDSGMGWSASKGQPEQSTSNEEAPGRSGPRSATSTSTSSSSRLNSQRPSFDGQPLDFFAQSRPSNDSAEDRAENDEEESFTMPQISPVPPKLDLDFGSFSLDFGSDFGSGSLSLGGGSVGFAAASKPAVASKPTPSAQPLGSKSATNGTVAPAQDLPFAAPPSAGSAIIRRAKESPLSSSASISSKSSSILDLGLGFPSRKPSLPDTTGGLSGYATARQPSQPENVADGKDNKDAPLASLYTPSQARSSAKQPAGSNAKEHSDVQKLSTKASPLSQLATSALTSHSLLELSAPSASSDPGSGDQDRTPKASSAAPTQTTFAQPLLMDQDQSGPASLARPDSPASVTSSSVSVSRPASSLLAHHQHHPRVDGPESDSKRTTLSSNDFGHNHGRAPSSLGHVSAVKGNVQSARLSVNKMLPALPGATHSDDTKSLRPSNLRTASALDVRSTGAARGADDNVSLAMSRRSMSESINDEARLQDLQHRTRSYSKGSRGSIGSSSSNGSSSSDLQPLQQLYTNAANTRSRSSTLEHNFTAHSTASAAIRGPHGSSASDATRNLTRMEVSDMGAGAPREQPAGPRTLAEGGGLEKQRPPRRDVWEGGELIKKDPATDKLLAAATEKLVKWMQGPSFAAREAQIARRSGDWTTSAARTESAAEQSLSAVSSVGVSRKESVGSGAPSAPPLSARVVSASAIHATAPIRMSTASVLALKDKNPNAPETKADQTAAPARTSAPIPIADPAPAPAPSLSSSLSSSITPAIEMARLAISNKQTTQSKPNPLSLNLDLGRPSSLFAKPAPSVHAPPQRKPAKKSGGELPFGQNWTDIEAALAVYRQGIDEGRADRASGVQTVLVPKYKEEELAAHLAGAKLSKRQRDLLFDWIGVLFRDLQGTPANRGACLEGIAVVVESRHMNYFAFDGDAEGKKRFEQTIASLLHFATDKLNGKAIFANTLGFAGKMLAAAFWNLDGVALKMLRLLPAVKKQHVLRILSESGVDDCPGTFPAHLACLTYPGDAAAYMRMFPPVRPGSLTDSLLYEATFDRPSQLIPVVSPGQDESFQEKQQAESPTTISIEMSGNWLIRWTATDSDLPFAFMRAYHRQLANYLPAFEEGQPALRSAQLAKAPGYLFITATLLEVCDALIHRNLRSVTTMAPSNTGVNANESAVVGAGQKPKGLEVVSKRVVQTIFEVVGGPLQAGAVTSSPQAYASAALRHSFGASLSVWIAAVTKRTSMWDTRGIFALLDLIEGLIFNVCSPPLEEGKEDDEDEVWQPSDIGLALFDTHFILSFIKTILSKADNTTCLLRTISFLYTEFASFTLRAADREVLCDGIILDPEVFERLFLYYNVGVRGYFLRLLVYRLSRLGSRDDGKPTLRDPRIFATLWLFESRLEKIRKRHDELDPLDDDWDSDDSFEDDFRPRAKRSTICSTWGVHDQPWAIDPYSSSRKPSMEGGEEDRADLSGLSSRSRDQHIEAIEEVPPVPALPEHIPPSMLLSNPSASSSNASLVVHSPAASNGKNTKLSTAKKVAGGWWQTLKNRKGSGNGQPNSTTSPLADELRPTSHEQISPFYEHAASSPSNSRIASATEVAQPPSPPTPPSEEAKYAEGSDVKPVARPLSRGSEANAIPPQLPDLLKVEPATDRLKKQSSRKSLRRGPSSASRKTAGASSAASPRSRRSSMYSFDLEVDTPRSDSFDFPISPSSTNGGALSPTTAAGSTAGGLGLSPLAFSALLDGNLNFAGSGAADGSATPLSPNRPRHQRGKSASSVRKSRPVSVASNRSGGNGPSPRVSKRFSKRASILPPPALNLLKESPSEPVPKIPEQYKTPTTANTQNGLLSAVFPNPAMSADRTDRPPSPPPYEQKKHAYAIRGLREYEDCLDEWELFVHRAKEEEGVDGRELSALIPRLQCAWPSTWEE